MRTKIIVILVLIASITAAHYSTEMQAHHYHLLYQGLFFIPIMLAGFWFGLKGALRTSIAITLIYIPFIILHWSGWSSNDANSILEVLLYNSVGALMGVLKDREERQQKRTREVESLAATGRAMSGLAHDIRTPLVAIGLLTRLVKRQMRKDHPGYKNLEEITSEIGRLEELLKDVLDFSRPLSLKRRTESIDEVVRESISIVEKATSTEAVTIAPDLHAGGLALSIDSARLKQALINLMNNAVQASPPDREVTVRTHPNSGDVVIEIIDYGEKIEPALLERIFEPFVTTKSGGTGLGLPIARRIIEAHDGTLGFRNNPGPGVTFTILLPVKS